jgi:hypothetical protein
MDGLNEELFVLEQLHKERNQKAYERLLINKCSYSSFASSCINY